MAQLTDDCFAFSGPLLPVDEVERIIGERVACVGETETVALKAACARVLADMRCVMRISRARARPPSPSSNV